MLSDKRVLVTGATGFLGAALCLSLHSLGIRPRAAFRSTSALPFISRLDSVPIPTISAQTRWTTSLKNIDVVIHTAARAHVLREDSFDPLVQYRLVNVEGTLNLARQAALAGVTRFIFISSIGVNGAFTERNLLLRGTAAAEAILGEGLPSLAENASRNHGSAFTANDVPMPTEDYAISKWEAEQGLWEIARKMGMEVVVIRPPLVYGPGVKGNFARLLDLVHSGVPLPLAAVNNRRSFIGLDNLVDLLIRCVDHPSAAGQTLLASDGRDLSTPELLRMIANAMGRPARLFPVPVPLLHLAGRALWRLNEVNRLVGSLQINSSATRELLGWNPPVSVEEGVGRMVRHYLAAQEGFRKLPT